MKKIISILLLSSLLFYACEDDKEEVRPVSRTIIGYMIADNNLSSDIQSDIDEMKRGFSETGATFLLFVDAKNKDPYLLKIEKQKSSVIRTYPELNSADYNEMKSILDECIRTYPAEEYGLILWSHGSSWLPAQTQLRAFGDDSGKQMNIKDLAQALPVKFDFIIFDACYMASIEVAYELKDKTDYIVAPSDEMLSDGFPYDKVIPELIKPKVNLQAVTQAYFDYYNSQPEPYRSATVSLIQTSQLSKLAEELSIIVANNTIDPAFDRTKIQRLDTYREQYIFDLLDFINQTYSQADKTGFINQLSKAVIYKANTPMLLQQYKVNNYCGLSCYIPHLARQDLNDFYIGLSWPIDSRIFQIFTQN